MFALSKQSQIQEAVDLFIHMDLNNLHIGPEIYGELLQACVYERALQTGKQIHARIIKKGEMFSRNEYIETKLVIFYAKCDDGKASNSLFRRVRLKNVFSWAAIIGLNCRLGLYKEALVGFMEMHRDGLLPDNFVVPNVLKACCAIEWIGVGRAVHGYVIKMGCDGCVFVASSLVDMYGKCGVVDEAREVFNEMEERNVITWNSMIVSYVQNGLNEESINVFCDMREEGVEPTHVTVSSFLSALANLGAVEEGKQGHGLAVVSGLKLKTIFESSIINFYAKVRLMEDAEIVFSRMNEKDVVTWNLLISGYLQSGDVDKGLDMCRLMRLENLRFDSVTLASLMSAFAGTRNLRCGKEAHCYCIRNYLEGDVVVVSSIVDLYANVRKLIRQDKLSNLQQLEILCFGTHCWRLMQDWDIVVSEAQDMFLQMQSLVVKPNVVTWTTMIFGLAENGFGHEAIEAFHRMQEAGITPNIVSIICVLKACIEMTSLQNGRVIHGYLIRLSSTFQPQLQPL